jgi:peptidoglycan/LPS O-acetylase OafA/YrhL
MMSDVLSTSLPGRDGPQAGHTFKDAERAGYIPELDVLRVIAVALVMLEHYLPYQLHKIGVDGGYGVWIFFTLSGFLITGILLDYGDRVGAGRVSVGEALRIFYIRRSLRIFPLFYAVVFLLFLTGMVSLHGELIWHLTYTTNIWTALNNEWGFRAGHLWSLAVEEQFYLVWPFVVLLAPRRHLQTIILASIAGAIGFRIWGVWTEIGLAVRVLPVAALDTLGAGALLALLHAQKRAEAIGLIRRCGVAALLILPFLALLPLDPREVLAPTLIAIASMAVIDACITGLPSWAAWAFRLRILQYLGGISYGLYIYHYVVRWYVPGTFGTDFGSHTANNVVSALTWSAATIIVAALSWHFFEKPINDRKKGIVLSR